MPAIFLRIEGCFILAAGTLLYFWSGYDWWWYALLFFSFDASALGYIVNPRVGALTYNAVHSFVGPVTLVTIGLLTDTAACTLYGLIWFAHLGFDRTIGFGFMKPTYFGDSNLNDLPVRESLVRLWRRLR